VEKEAGLAEAIEVHVGLGDDEFIEVSGANLEEGDAIILGYWREP
jgi:hypothetical protein